MRAPMKFAIYRGVDGVWVLRPPDTVDVPHWWWPTTVWPTFPEAVAAFDRALAQTRSGLDLVAAIVFAAPRPVPTSRLYE